MKKIIINENQKGFLFHNGKFVKMLDAGKYHTYGDKCIEVVDMNAPLHSDYCDIDTLIKNEELARNVSVVEVTDQQLALHFIEGKFDYILRAGKHAFWNTGKQHTFQLVDISTPTVAAEVPEYIFNKVPNSYFTKVEISEYERGRLYYNLKLEKILEPGVYYFWKTSVNVNVGIVDIRLTQMNITGQEILTKDKVSLRINFVCSYKITDYTKILTEIDDYKEQMHVAAQLALREYVGKYTLDEILENKEEMSKYVFERLKEKEKNFFVEVIDGGVKDIILPGEIRDIMNTVLIAEKRAQANVISRREEVSSTRSLLNTAKLMDENQTLYRLKEMEFIERICENVDNINLNGNGDLLTQLTQMLRTKAS